MSVVAVAVGIWVAVAYVVATIWPCERKSRPAVADELRSSSWGLACRARDER